MNLRLEPMTLKQRGILRRMRPPSAKPLLLSVPYKHEGNPGNTYGLQEGEQAVCPADGVVSRMRQVPGRWQHGSGALDKSISYEITVDHGYALQTVIHGLKDTKVQLGAIVTRGSALGSLLASEILFQVVFQGALFDPTTINRHFVPQDGSLIPGMGGYLKQSPDLIQRDLSSSIISAMQNGIRYFFSLAGAPKVLVNVDFNGSGNKRGAAAAGIGVDDYWSVISPQDFVSVSGYYCSDFMGSPRVLNKPGPQIPLNDYTGDRSTAYLVRVMQSSTYGTSSAFDPMLATWVGGYSGETPVQTCFEMHGLRAGHYSLYLYANDGVYPSTTSFYVSKNGVSPALKVITTTSDPAWVENYNYALFSIDITDGDYILLNTYGYWSGLQALRT